MPTLFRCEHKGAAGRVQCVVRVPPMHGGFQLDPWSAARIVEVGDVPFPRANDNEACIEQMSEFYGRIDAASTRPTSIAGDHSLTGGIVQAIRRGSIADGELVAFLHLDAHTDVFTKIEHFLGARKSAAHWAAYLADQGLADSSSSTQIGLRRHARMLY